MFLKYVHSKCFQKFKVQFPGCAPSDQYPKWLKKYNLTIVFFIIFQSKNMLGILNTCKISVT